MKCSFLKKRKCLKTVWLFNAVFKYMSCVMVLGMMGTWKFVTLHRVALGKWWGSARMQLFRRVKQNALHGSIGCWYTIGCWYINPVHGKKERRKKKKKKDWMIKSRKETVTFVQIKLNYKNFETWPSILNNGKIYVQHYYFP